MAPSAVLKYISGEKTNIEARPDAVPATLDGKLSSLSTENCIAYIIVEKIPGIIEIVAIKTILFGIPKISRIWLNPNVINNKVDIDKHIVANLNHLSVEWKILSAIIPENIAAKIIIKYVLTIVKIPDISFVSPQTAVIYGVK